MNTKTINIYRFKHAPDIYANEEGVFYRMSDDRPIKTIFHAGRVAVRDRKRIYGIKRLRKNAYKSNKTITQFYSSILPLPKIFQ